MKISNISLKNNMINNIRRNYNELAKSEKQLTTGKKFQNISENTTQAITSIFSKIRTNQINQFIKNAEDSESYIQVAHDKISQVTKMMHRIKELTIQAANGTESKESRLYIATEVEELMKEMINLANSTFQDNYLFSGSKEEKPFIIEYELNTDLGKEVVSDVIYQGDDFTQSREIGQKEMVDISLPGSRAFWGSNHSVLSLKDNTGFNSQIDQKIRIDGFEVSISQNDNLERIIDKINHSVPSVTAFKQDIPNGAISLGIESQFPHKLFLEDLEGGSFFQEIGITQVGEAGNYPPNNLHNNILEKNGSLFDVLIDLRNSMLNNNTESIGTKNLYLVDQSINNLLKNQAKISSVDFRLEIVRNDLETEKVTLRERISKSEDMNMVEASVRFSELNSIHQIGLKAAARYVNPTLLDYL